MVTMDFLENFNLDLTSKRSRRVRSWYLREQYKALEKSQRQATQQLRTSQERLLHRELSEHHRRRNMSAVSGCRSEPCGDCHESPSCASCVKEYGYDQAEFDLMDASGLASFCVDDDDERHRAFSETFISIAASEILGSNCDLDVPVPELILDDDPSFLMADSSANFAEELKEELESEDTTPVSLDPELEMKEDVKDDEDVYTRLPQLIYEEKIVKFGEQPIEDDVSKYAADTEDAYEEGEDGDSTVSMVSEKSEPNVNTDIFTLWSKLVSFAYQIVQLNQGNCYYDYSSQFMTAVLACDVIRRGISRMCNVLQPYVSPVKFTSSRVCIDDGKTSIKKERSIQNSQSKITIKSVTDSKSQTKKNYNPICGQKKTNLKSMKQQREGSCKTKNFQCQYSSSKSKALLPKDVIKKNSSSHRSLTLTSDKYCSTIWLTESSKNDDYDSCRTRVTNPMLDLAKYIDRVVQDQDTR